MVKVYADLIIAGVKTLEEIPKRLQLAVTAELEKRKSQELDFE